MPQPIATIVGNIFVEGWGKPSPYGTYVAYRNFFYKTCVVRRRDARQEHADMTNEGFSGNHRRVVIPAGRWESYLRFKVLIFTFIEFIFLVTTLERCNEKGFLVTTLQRSNPKRE